MHSITRSHRKANKARSRRKGIFYFGQTGNELINSPYIVKVKKEKRQEKKEGWVQRTFAKVLRVQQKV